MPQKIDSFSGEYDWLSNFYPSKITMSDGLTYPSVEHAFQAHKTNVLSERKAFCSPSAPTPGKAKRMGRKLKLRNDWEQIKIAVMKEAVWRKFEDPQLREKLLATGDAKLIEGNHWNDRFWGVCKGVGKNHLGQILMEVRNKIREQNGHAV